MLTALHIVFILFLIIVGFCHGDSKNFTQPHNPKNAGGFFPFGPSGVFNGAAMVYLSYIGYDAVSTMAEEVRNPVKDIPVGVSGSVILVTILYCLMAASMSMLLPYDSVRYIISSNCNCFNPRKNDNINNLKAKSIDNDLTYYKLLSMIEIDIFFRLIPRRRFQGHF